MTHIPGERITNTHVFFWNGIFSQWHRLGFNDGKHHYLCAEQYMMAKKAELFNDVDTFEKIMAAKDPRSQKALGRQVKGFDPDVWDTHKFDIVVDGNMLKFGKHPIAKTLLMNTEKKTIVEASPYDQIWGIGLHFDDERVLNESKWQGHNLLGKALMKVRELLCK